MEMKSCFMIAIFVALAILHSGEARKCYVCPLEVGESCEKLTDKNKKDCLTPLNHCATCTAKLSNKSEFVTRSCAQADVEMINTHATGYVGTQKLELESVHCNFCNEDLCNNNANGMSINMVTLGGLALLWAFLQILINS
nr:PREDICTED: uncharacterized protein LOC105677784 [Linepithema humile]